MALGPGALWKLNEQTGVIAHDSSGNALDLSVPISFVPPTWGGPILPPGETSAMWFDSAGFTRMNRPSFPSYAGDFTVGGWFERLTGDLHSYFCVSQGDGINNGFGLEIRSDAATPFPDCAVFSMQGSGGRIEIGSDAKLINNVPYAIAIRRQSSVCSIHIAGIKQSTTMTPAYTAGTGFNMGSAASACSSYVYAFPSALSDAQILAIAESV
jgi:hypothetical protein